DFVRAVPPTVWNKTALRVPMPDPAPQMGLAVKNLAPVKKAFWKETKHSQWAYGDGDISMTWDATDPQPADPPADETTCLTAFSGGPAAEKARSRTGEARQKAYADAYEQMFPGFKDNALQINPGSGPLHLHLLHRPHDHLRHHPVPHPLAVRGDDPPRRVPRGAARQGVLIGPRVVIPVLPLLDVPRRELPVPGRIVQP